MSEADPPSDSPGTSGGTAVEIDASLRRQIARWATGRRWGAAVLAVMAIFLPLVVALAAPRVYEQPLGMTTAASATVTSVRLHDDQPRRHRNTAWEVGLRWIDPAGETKTRVERLVRRDDPPAVGEVLPIAITREGQVSFETDQGSWVLLLTVIAMVVLFVAGAVAFWMSAARSLMRRGKLDPPRAVPVVTTGRSELTTKWKLQFGPRQYSLGYRPEQSGAPGGSFAVDGRDDGRLPEVGDRLQVWTSRPNGRGPFLVRRPADDTWWLGGGPDPVPAFGPPSRG
ncbi:hypothetical protein FDO65_12345 [Nakamurella flava]|uniref:DUF3592 domain-containing protein n=1 Tax=Nakamurella flava TaxID=2576308 RepID=A0A4U6QEG7_9ACTN|nr:hypothetical protein [Nakamurella flava]TKV58359.1 hypothetical protein FDO65_12345 [Nakamurella flava]